MAGVELSDGGMFVVALSMDGGLVAVIIRKALWVLYNRLWDGLREDIQLQSVLNNGIRTDVWAIKWIYRLRGDGKYKIKKQRCATKKQLNSKCDATHLKMANGVISGWALILRDSKVQICNEADSLSIQKVSLRSKRKKEKII